MKYTEAFRVKWHDTSADRSVRLSEILAYMQETANLQVKNSCAESLDEIRDTKKLAFILSKIKLVFHAPLYAYDDIKVRTWVCESRGYTFIRCFDIYRQEELIAEGISFWALVDIDNGKLVKSGDFSLGIEPEAPLDIDVPRRIKISEECLEVLGEREIRYSDIDYNMHMNNTKYPDMICDHLPIDKIRSVREMTLEFLHESTFGDKLTVKGASDGEHYLFKTVNKSGDTCLVADVLIGQSDII